MLATDEALAPAIWPMEVANSLLTAQRGGRITPAEIATVTDWLTRLPIRVQAGVLGPAVNEVLALARRAGTTAYDASYLHLALSTGLALATIDGPLNKACERIGVQTLTL